MESTVASLTPVAPTGAGAAEPFSGERPPPQASAARRRNGIVLKVIGELYGAGSWSGPPALPAGLATSGWSSHSEPCPPPQPHRPRPPPPYHLAGDGHRRSRPGLADPPRCSNPLESPRRTKGRRLPA